MEQVNAQLKLQEGYTVENWSDIECGSECNDRSTYCPVCNWSSDPDEVVVNNVDIVCAHGNSKASYCIYCSDEEISRNTGVCKHGVDMLSYCHSCNKF